LAAVPTASAIVLPVAGRRHDASSAGLGLSRPEDMTAAELF
jgi:hypothetical protein